MRYVSHDRHRVGSGRVSATGAGCHSCTMTVVLRTTSLRAVLGTSSMHRMLGLYSVPNAPREKSCSYVRWSCCTR